MNASLFWLVVSTYFNDSLTDMTRQIWAITRLTIVKPISVPYTFPLMEGWSERYRRSRKGRRKRKSCQEVELKSTEGERPILELRQKLDSQSIGEFKCMLGTVN